MSEEKTLTPDQRVAQIEEGLHPDQKQRLEESQKAAPKIPPGERKKARDRAEYMRKRYSGGGPKPGFPRR